MPPRRLLRLIRAEHDREAADRGGDAKRQIVSYPELGKLCSLPMIMEKVKQLMGAYGNGETECAMHHVHANRQLPGTGSSNWHQVRSHAVVQSAATLSGPLSTAGLRAAAAD